MVEVERTIHKLAQEGTPELQGEVVWRVARCAPLFPKLRPPLVIILTACQCDQTVNSRGLVVWLGPVQVWVTTSHRRVIFSRFAHLHCPLDCGMSAFGYSTTAGWVSSLMCTMAIANVLAALQHMSLCRLGRHDP